MPIISVYEDFLKFLEELDKGGAPWELYEQYYFRPHSDFLLCYWRNFTWMNLDQIEARVERIRRNDYSTLESLLHRESPEEIVGRALRRCENIFPAPEEPTIYLIVGFFSSEGFVIQSGGKPVIGIGLERFRDFRPLGLIFAHEYCHYLRSLSSQGPAPEEERTLGYVLLSEGLSSLFSQLVFPERPLYEHLLISRATLNWCLANEDYVRSLLSLELDSPRLIPVLFKTGSHELGIPPRVGTYFGYSLLKEYQERTGAAISQLLELDRLPNG